MRIIYKIAGLILAAIVVDFALSNRQDTLVGIWPLVEGLAMPLFLAMLLPLLAGLLLGWMLAGWRARQKRRSEKKAEK